MGGCAEREGEGVLPVNETRGRQAGRGTMNKEGGLRLARPEMSSVLPHRLVRIASTPISLATLCVCVP